MVENWVLRKTFGPKYQESENNCFVILTVYSIRYVARTNMEGGAYRVFKVKLQKGDRDGWRAVPNIV
jgi:hypothetical protein